MGKASRNAEAARRRRQQDDARPSYPLPPSYQTDTTAGTCRPVQQDGRLQDPIDRRRPPSSRGGPPPTTRRGPAGPDRYKYTIRLVISRLHRNPNPTHYIRTIESSITV